MTKEIIEKLAKPGTPLELKDVSVEIIDKILE